MSDLARLQPILNTALDAVVVMDAHGALVDWNARAEAVFGWRREEILGRPLGDVIVPPHLRAAHHDGLVRFLATREPRALDRLLEMTAIRRGGEAFPVELSVTHWGEEDPGLFLGFIRDISERRDAVDRLAASEARFRAAIEAVQGVLWTNNAQGEMIGEQPGWAGLTGQTAEAYQGFGWTRALHPDDIQPTLQAWLAAVAERRTFEWEHRVRRRDGVWRDFRVRAIPWFERDGTIREWVGVHTDVTEEKAAEVKLRESEALFRTLADAAPAPVWMTAPEGGVEFVNAAFSEFSGVGKGELLGQAWISLIHPDDVAQVLARRHAARVGPEAYSFEARFRRQPEGWRWMLVHAKPRIDANGVFLGYVGMAMDLTEIKMAEIHQQLLINELNHRVKNTLASIQSIARQTLRPDQVDPQAREQFIDRLLAMSAAHNILTSESWAGAVVDDIVREALRPFVDERDPERVSIAGAPLRVLPGTALALALAVHELGTNAVKYGALSCPEGRVRIDWSVDGGKHAVLRWREEHGPPVHEPTRRGFGARLLERGLTADLGGKPELVFAPEGVVARLPLLIE